MAELDPETSPILLDSHAFLWALGDSELLGPNVRAALTRGRETWLSAATVWELGIKHALGRLVLPIPLPDLIRRAIADGGMKVLEITPMHAIRASALPMHHKDPFDRMLIAQAMTERFLLATVDGKANTYDVATLW